MAHAPQFWSSVCKSVQPALPTQQVCPAAQVSPPLQEQTELPCFLLQASPGAQTTLSQEHRCDVGSQVPGAPEPEHCEASAQPQPPWKHPKPPACP